MAQTTLAQIREKLKAQQAASSKTSSPSDKAVYPHWNAAEGTTTGIRFLPDGNKDNTFFWQERAMIKLPFPGIKDQPDSKPVTVQVPCVEMWGEACPILAEVRPWFKAKDATLEELGRKYWKKRSYLFQGFVRVDPLKEETPENPIRRFIIGPQIFNIVKTALLDPEFESLPTDYLAGLDFKIVKTSKGGYADYSTSAWNRKESALTKEEQDAIEQYGLFDLSSFLPRKPGAVELAVIKQMFDDSVDGLPYDPDKYSQYYRPIGYQGPATEVPAGIDADEEAEEPVTTAAPKAAPAAKAAPKAAPAAEAQTSGSSSDRAKGILEMIKNRQKASA